MLKKIKTWLKENRADAWIMLGLFLLAAVPRIWGLGAFLTADEKNWMGRSYEFIRAVKDLRFNDTLQTTHPGVTTLWIVGLAITAKSWLVHVPFSYQNLIYFVKAAQFPIALLNALAIPVMYLFLRKLFMKPRFATPEEQATASTSGVFLTGRFFPLLASLFIALDPFLIGHSRVAHVDALLASFMFLAALSTMIYAREWYKRSWLITSAVLTALAILTKAPAVFLVPFWWLVVFPAKRFRDFALWLVVISVLFVTLWPAMLFVPDPKGNVLLLKRDLGAATVTPHDTNEEYTLEANHYLATLLARTTSVTLAFSGLAVVWLLAKIPMTKSQGPIKSQWFLVAYVSFFIVMMTLVAKKGDRYILPVFPALDVLAAFGIGFLGRYRRVLGVVAVMYLALVVWSYHPYAIAYSNPLFRDNLSQELGWGEGLEQVAHWLNQNHPATVVASWYSEELAAFTTAHVAHIQAHEQSKVQYVVLYRNMFGRTPDHYANNFIDEYYKKRQPVFIAQVVGKEFAWVYEKWTFPRIVGELVPGKRVSQEITVTYDNLVGLDLMIANYSGKAKSGDLIVASPGIHTWKIPISEIQDDRWLTLHLPEPLHLSGQKISVEIFAEGTQPGNAPTVRANKERLAIRLRFAVGDGQEATEEDTRLLQ